MQRSTSENRVRRRKVRGRFHETRPWDGFAIAIVLRDKLPVLVFIFSRCLRSADEIFLGIIAWDVRWLESASFPSAISWRTRPQPACSLAHVFHREKDGFPCAGDGFEMMNSLGVRPRSKPRDISWNCLRASKQFRVCESVHAPPHVRKNMFAIFTRSDEQKLCSNHYDRRFDLVMVNLSNLWLAPLSDRSAN